MTAMDQKTRDAKTAAKRTAVGETELRHRVRPGIRAMLSRWECRDAMSFPAGYQLPDNHRLAVHLLGNAVCPRPVAKIITELQKAA